jgi:hypothetical protein
MGWIRGVAVGANAACTGFTVLSLVPVAVIYPAVAELCARHQPGPALLSIPYDAILCFGPLTLPFFSLLGLMALRSAYCREPAAIRLNLSAVAVHLAAMAAGVVLVATWGSAG